MFERVIGIVTFKAPTYRVIAGDETAIKQAAILVMVVALIQGVCGDLVTTIANGTRLSLSEEILSAVLNVILGLIVWVIIAWLLAVIARAFGGKTGIGEMLRVAGFVQVFGLVSAFSLVALINPAATFVNLLIALAILGLSLAGYFLGVREAAQLSKDKAIITAILASIASFVIIFLVDRISNAVIPSLLRIVG
jgi:hypothetical protein